MKSPYLVTLSAIITTSFLVLASGLLVYHQYYLEPKLAIPDQQTTSQSEKDTPFPVPSEYIPLDLDTPFFINHLVSSSTYVELTDLPSISQLNNQLRNVVRYKDRILVNDDYSHILKFSKDGQLIAMSDPKALHGCPVSEIAVINDRLYIGCSGRGIYVVDLISGSLVKAYTSQDGFNPFNIQLVPIGNQLWVGTFDGVYRLDTEREELFAYKEKELHSNCESNGSNVIEHNGEIWVVVGAHNTCSGGAAHYLPLTDEWKFFGTADFQGPKERIDFDHFLFLNDELFAESYTENSPQTNVHKYDKATDSWILENNSTQLTIYAQEHSSFGVVRNPGYTVREIPSKNNRESKYEISFSDGTKTRLPHRSYVAMAPSPTGYWLVSSDGLEIYDNEINFPGKSIVAKINLDIGDYAIVFTTNDAKEIFVVSFSQSEYDGMIYYYNVFAFGLPDFKTALEKRFTKDTFALENIGKVMPDFRKATLLKKEDGTYSIKDANGDEFIINPATKTIRASKSTQPEMY